MKLKDFIKCGVQLCTPSKQIWFSRKDKPACDISISYGIVRQGGTKRHYADICVLGLEHRGEGDFVFDPDPRFEWERTIDFEKLDKWIAEFTKELGLDPDAENWDWWPSTKKYLKSQRQVIREALNKNGEHHETQTRA